MLTDSMRVLLPGSKDWQEYIGDGLSQPTGGFNASVRLGDHLWCLGGTTDQVGWEQIKAVRFELN